MVRSRLCDFAARELQSTGRSFYSIASAGHESNAAVALALRPTDPALLHYRSGAFYLARAAQAGRDGVPDILRGVTAATSEPIAGGRHKVFGNHELAVIPQTSTIASHLPRAVGVAFAIERAKKLGLEHAWPDDAVVVCTFGDASVNHATAQAGLNSAAHLAHQGAAAPAALRLRGQRDRDQRPLPSGMGGGGVARPRRRFDTSSRRATTRRSRSRSPRISPTGPARRAARRPPPPHRALPQPRGSGRRSRVPDGEEIRADWDLDPILGAGRWLAACGRSGEELAADYLDRARARARRGRRGRSAAAARDRRRGRCVRSRRGRRPRLPPGEAEEPTTVALAINAALAGELERDPSVLLFGEDVAVKGGVYGVTRGLQRRFGAGRVFDTLLDETSILGLALGSAVSGLLPVPGDPVPRLPAQRGGPAPRRGGDAPVLLAGALPERDGRARRRARLPEGFGGHFHNDNAVGVLRDIPGLVVASPGRPDDAAAMLRTCLEAARVGRDRLRLPRADRALPHPRPPRGGRRGVACAAGRATRRSAWGGPTATGATSRSSPGRTGFACRSASPAARGAGRSRARARPPLARAAPGRGPPARGATRPGACLVVDETRRTGGVSEGVVAALVDAGFDGRIARVASKDSFIPLGDAANLVLLSEEEILEAGAGALRLALAADALLDRRELGGAVSASSAAVTTAFATAVRSPPSAASRASASVSKNVTVNSAPPGEIADTPLVAGRREKPRSPGRCRSPAGPGGASRCAHCPSPRRRLRSRRADTRPRCSLGCAR